MPLLWEHSIAAENASIAIYIKGWHCFTFSAWTEQLVTKYRYLINSLDEW